MARPVIPPGGPPGWRPFLEEILNMVEALERRLDELEKAVKDLDRKLREQRQELERLINHRTLVKPS